MENMPDNVKDNPVGKREALLADRLRLHKGYRYTEVEIFSKGDFTLGTNWFEGEVTVGDVAEFSSGVGTRFTISWVPDGRGAAQQAKSKGHANVSKRYWQYAERLWKRCAPREEGVSCRRIG